MECDRLREVLFDHVDGLLGRDEAEAARDHLAACAPCRALQEEVRRNFSALDAWEEEDLPEGAFARLEGRVAAARDDGSPAPRRSWVRLAVPYAAGIATAAAHAWVFVLPHGGPLPSPAPGPAPGASPDPVARGAGDLDTPASASRFSGTPGSPVAGGPSLRPGERPLEFRDADQGVWRRLRLPPGVDPGKVLLVDAPERILPDDDGVR